MDYLDKLEGLRRQHIEEYDRLTEMRKRGASIKTIETQLQLLKEIREAILKLLPEDREVKS